MNELHEMEEMRTAYQLFDDIGARFYVEGMV